MCVQNIKHFVMQAESEEENEDDEELFEKA